jgi:hypothetical protein
MKSLTLRSCLALACALGLAGCGGGSGTLQLGGTVQGLNKDGLILSNNGGTGLTVTNPSGVNVNFAFPDLIGVDTAFDVEVAHQPDGAFCTPFYNKGKTGAYSVVSIVISCATYRHNLTGTVSGLASDGLIVVNGADSMAISAGATSFSMTKGAPPAVVTGTVADGDKYGLTVLHQPATGTCQILNGVGQMGANDVTNIQIICN